MRSPSLRSARHAAPPRPVMRLFSGLVVLGAIVIVPAIASAQPTSAPLSFWPMRTDSNGSVGVLDLGTRSYGTSCSDSGEGAASRWLGTSYRSTLRLVPNLTLVGLSQAGCDASARIGVALVYVVPLKPSVSLALSMGPSYVHKNGATGGSAMRISARVDLMFKRPEGRNYNISVGTSGVSFTGRL